MKYAIILVLTLASSLALPSNDTIFYPEGRITGGQDAVTKQFPYQVHLYITDDIEDTKNYDSCGGSLLNNQWVLTAAHCTIKAKKVLVLLGAVSRTAAVHTHTVTHENIVNHPDYKDGKRSLLNDIALIKIPCTQYSTSVQPIKLPPEGKSYSDYNEQKVLASGWGWTSDKKNSLASKLQWARLKVISNKVCSKDFKISSKQICTATVKGVNVCEGDSGGPLVLEKDKIQIGIMSFTDTKCKAPYPGVFTRVTSYLGWINNNIKKSSCSC